jgi:hypothetical protein
MTTHLRPLIEAPTTVEFTRFCALSPEEQLAELSQQNHLYRPFKGGSLHFLDQQADMSLHLAKFSFYRTTRFNFCTLALTQNWVEVWSAGALWQYSRDIWEATVFADKLNAQLNCRTPAQTLSANRHQS